MPINIVKVYEILQRKATIYVGKNSQERWTGHIQQDPGQAIWRWYFNRQQNSQRGEKNAEDLTIDVASAHGDEEPAH